MSATEPSQRRLAGARLLVFASLGSFLLLAALVGGIALTGTEKDGEPSVHLALGSASDTAGTTQKGLGVGQAKRFVGGNLVSDLAFLEDSADGALPRISADGRAPMVAYAHPFGTGDKRPRIAIVVTGLGVSESATAAALAKLPVEVTFALSPFTANLQLLVDKIRGQGHEILLQVPMEPFDYPDSDPGPHALLVAASGEENGKLLNWVMGRATGYVGLTNLMGARFLGETGAIEPVLEILAARGLLFYDTGAGTNSVAATAARHAGTTIATGTLVVDAVQTPDAIDGQLAELEKDARQNGFAIGTAALYPVTIERLAQWVSGLNSRGVALAPLTAVASRPDFVAPSSTPSSPPSPKKH